MNIELNIKNSVIPFFERYWESLLSHILFDPNLNIELNFRDTTLLLGRNKPEREPISKAKSDIILKDRNHWIPVDGNFFVPQSSLDDYFKNPETHKQYIFLGLLDVDDGYLWNHRKDINWDYFCLNKHYYWTIERIKLFEEHINFKKLSFNCNIETDRYIIEDYIDSWDWNGLSGNPSVSHQLLIRYFHSKVVWRSKTESILGYYRALDEVNKNYSGKNFQESGRREFSSDNLRPSLSTNPNIFWEKHVFERFKDQVDLWQIARYSNFSFDLLENYSHLLNENKKFRTVYKRYSDWHDEYLEYRNGWENLALNNNYVLGKEALELLSDKKTKLIRYDGDARSGYKEKIVEMPLLSILKPSQVKIDFLDLIKKDLPLPTGSALISGYYHTDNNQLKYYNSSNKIHDDIYKNIISPVISANPELLELFIENCIKKRNKCY